MVSTIDLSAFQYFLPLVAFLIVFLVTLVVLFKTKFIDNLFLELLISFLVAIVFISFAGPQRFVASVTPAVAVLIVSAFFILLLAGMFGKALDLNKGLGIIFVVILFIIFIVSAFFAFSSSISPYLPGGDASQADQTALLFTDWLFSSRVGGAILLVIVSALVAWVLVKVKG